MSISKYNNEGYPDPTAYDALSSIENEAHALRAFRPIVYICSPFAGDIEKNVAAARTYSRFAVEQGYIPIAPHLLFPQFLNDSDPKERELGLFFGNAIMSKCSEIWVFGSHISSGMEAEIKRAKRRYGRAWKRIRDSYADAHPLCEMCLENGVYTTTEQIHHVKPLSQGGTHDRENLMALCKSCHAKIHAEHGDRWHNR